MATGNSPDDAPLLDPVLGHPALRHGLITYLGNKRGLVPFISAAIDRVEAQIGPLIRMADPFTGSGVVARLGRLRGMEVWASDVQDYTRPFGRAFLETQPGEIDNLFASTGGYAATLAELNSLNEPTESDRLFSRHYAPASTADADPERERMFYTQENARRIDAMLAAIHRDFPLSDRARDILLAGLLVKMSVHNNTSGVMKGFHHGWGGRGGDALSRIMAPIELTPLPFISGPRGTTHVGTADEVMRAAGRASRSPAFDIVYADPPYNIHQYGANYHLLTTAVRWDFYNPGPVEAGTRAGIRRDHIRSAWCSRRAGQARHAFERFLAATDTRSLLLSYNNDGIIEAREIIDLLSEDGLNTVEVLRHEHQKFKGGKATQGAVRTNEYLFVVLRGVRQSRKARSELRARVEELALSRSTADRFLIPSRWEAAGGTVVERDGPVRWTLSTPAGSRIDITEELRVAEITVVAKAVDGPAGSGAAADAAAGRDRAAHGPVTEVVTLAHASDGTIVAAVEELISRERYTPAIALLQRLKIRKYRSDFVRLAMELRERPLSDVQRRRLDALIHRVTGETPPEDPRR